MTARRLSCCLALLLVSACLAPSDASDSQGDTDTEGDPRDEVAGDSESMIDLDEPDGSDSERCPALAAPTGPVIRVDTSQVGELRGILAGAESGTTVLLSAGEYHLHGDYLWIATEGVSLRGATGDRDDVIIDGDYETTEIVSVAASNVTIADLTLRRARTHPIHVMGGSEGDTTGTVIYNVHIVDPGQQAIKINQSASMDRFPDDGEVACSHIELTDEGRPIVLEINGSCYTGGVDGHQARGWRVRDNLIEGFWCLEGLSEHGVHFWTGSRDTVVERNLLRDNARGVGYGLGSSGAARAYADEPCSEADYVGHFGGVIRNNMIWVGRAELYDSASGFDCGICLEQACGSAVLHNTVASTRAPFSSIEWRWPNTDIRLVNNLVTHNLRARDGGQADEADNLAEAPAEWFVDLEGADLHLSAAAEPARNAGAALEVGECDLDFDGEGRDRAHPDVGADED